MNNWIICLKHGTKYNSIYVNKLYNMVRRHSTLPFKFGCITEDSIGLDPSIHIITLPNLDITGWWWKLWVFDKNFPINGTILFMDLDIVIVKNIDNLWAYEPGKFCVIKDFNRTYIPDYKKFNSSIFKMDTGKFSHVWDNYIINSSLSKKMHGDQDWIAYQITEGFSFWPDNWIRSYKWEIRNRSDLVLENRKRRFKNIANPNIDSNTSILVFHGDPKPDEVFDPIIIDNWK